jgi:hypothetical protein
MLAPERCLRSLADTRQDPRALRCLPREPAGLPQVARRHGRPETALRSRPAPQ